MLTYLEKCTCPDIAYVVHQLARCVADPRRTHGEEMRCLVRNLIGTREIGIMIEKGDNEQELVCHMDADFVGNYNNKRDQSGNIETDRSQYGYLIRYRNIPISWVSRLQTLVALSSTESENISLSEEVRAVIPVIRLIMEVKKHGFIEQINSPVMKCKFMEDNNGAIALATIPKVRERTKNIHLRFHLLVSLIQEGVMRVDTEDQDADILTNPLGPIPFRRHRRKIMSE